MIGADFDLRRETGMQFVLDMVEPVSPYGRERLKNLRFYRPSERAELEAELTYLERVRHILRSQRSAFDEIELYMMSMKDIRKSVACCGEGQCLGQTELLEIKGFLLQLGAIYPIFSRVREAFDEIGVLLDPVAGAIEIIDPDVPEKAGFHIADNRTGALFAIRQKKKHLERRLYKAKAAAEKEELKGRRDLICEAEEEEERKIREEISKNLTTFTAAIADAAVNVGKLDLLIQKAKLADELGGVRPVLTDAEIDFKEMVNPQLKSILEEDGTFTPVSIKLAKGATVITGANMGGKSMTLKTVALNVLLAHAGFFPFAKEAAIPLFENIRCIFDTRQSLEKGLSGFGTDIVALNAAFSQMERGYSLLLIDEFARGISPQEGAAVVKGLTAYLDGRDAISVLTTHYEGVATLASAHYQVTGLRDFDWGAAEAALAAGGDSLTLLRRLMDYGLYRAESSPCPRDAVKICELLSLNGEVLDKIHMFH